MLLLASSAFALPLLVERFDVSTLPAGWKTAVAVQAGGGKPSTVAVEDGALVLRAEARTKRFSAFSQKLELRDVTWIRVTARTRTEGVDPAAMQGTCGLYVRFEGGEPLSAGPCTGADWVASTRSFAVPDGARDVEVGFLLTGAGTARFDDLLVEPVTPDWKELGRGGFTYHWLGGDTFREDQLVTNDETLDRAIALVGAQPKGRIHYYKHADLDAIEEYTGVRAEAVVRGSTVHTIVRTDPRAIVKALAGALGEPPPLLAEGLAVSFAGEWNGRDLRQASRALGGDAPTLSALLDPRSFAALPADRAYPVAGAFVVWVGATKGPDAVKALYGALKSSASPADNEKALAAGLGMSLAEADAALRAWW